MDSRNHSSDSGTAARLPGEQTTRYTSQPAISKRGAFPAAWLVGGLAALTMCSIATASLWFVGFGNALENLQPAKVGQLQVESRSIPQGSATSVAVNVNMGQGTLMLAGGAGGLLDAESSYKVDAWKPNVTYNETAAEGALSIEQTRSQGFALTPDGVRNDWNLRLKDGIPLTLAVSLGSGNSTIKLDGLSVSELDLSTGAGAVTLDLTGHRTQSLNATLNGGAGNITIRLPSDVGARLKVESGAANVDASGLRRDGSYYTNEAYGKTAVTLEITIKTGAGNVKIEPDR